jgi:hypothetical protein
MDDDWTPSDNAATGFRSVITLQRNSVLCDNGAPGMVSDWVGIDNNAGSKITQIGFYHERISGVTHYERFWAIDDGTPNFYKEGDTDGTSIYFKVAAKLEGDTWFLVPYDCGASDFSTCTAENFDEQAYSASYGYVKAETNYGGSGCTAVMAGSSTTAASFDAIQGQHAYSTTWGDKSLSERYPTCNHYKQQDYGNTAFYTWDNRN